MHLRTRAFTAVTAAALLAITTGGGTAFAEPEEPEATGSLSSSDLDLAGTIGDLALAAEALNGPVTVTPNEDGGATVTYTNEGEDDDRCVGFVTPYSTIVDGDIDVNYDKAQLAEGIAVLTAIEAWPGMSMLLGDPDGEPFARVDDPAVPEELLGEVLDLLFDFNPVNAPAEAVTLEPGESITWTTTVPDSPAAAGIMCTSGVVQLGTVPEVYFGIDKQVVVDQINGKIPGGSLDVVSAGSISGGSVGVGAALTGSLAGGGDEEAPVTPAE